ncbi:heme exporter protein CcmD [Brevundimonas sp.]|nr:heme exporter protein CcmD [Brevundimonas sp.]
MLDLDMGDYGFYVWGSYAVSALVLGGLAVRVWVQARAARRALEAREPGA